MEKLNLLFFILYKPHFIHIYILTDIKVMNINLKHIFGLFFTQFFFVEITTIIKFIFGVECNYKIY